MNYPSINEYKEAILFAEDNFEQMKNLRPVLDDDGSPVMTSGNFAVVFKMKDEQTGKLHAVKCFLREQEGRAEAYRMISEELEYVSSTFLTPIKYLDKELFVDTNAGDEKEFPVLLMDWVEGETLDKYIRKHLDDQYELSLIAYQFSRLTMWLMPQPFAHGDLKPDNILVKSDGTLVLVDYDGMYVPAMKGQKARELGSPDFRHPSRTETDFDEHIDDFSLASILLSLKAISLQPSLLEEYGAQDRLLFSANDYRNLSESKTLEALRPLMQNAEFATLLLIFNYSSFQSDLSWVSIRFFNLAMPNRLEYEDENLTTEVTEEDLANGWMDESEVKYSKDKKRLLNASNNKRIIKHWSFSDFAEEFGKVIYKHNHNPESGAPYTTLSFRKSKEDNDPHNAKFVQFSRNLGELSKAELKAQWQSLQVIQEEVSPEVLASRAAKGYQLETYVLCKKGTLLTYSVMEGTKVICDNAFEKYAFLEKVELPQTIRFIGADAFSSCQDLTSINLPNNLETIGHRSFYSCPIGDINLPNSLESIENSTFESCSNLKTIIFPHSIKKIGNRAFSNCSSLQSVYIPKDLSNIGKDVFSGCSSLDHIYIEKGTKAKFEKLLSEYKSIITELEAKVDEKKQSPKENAIHLSFLSQNQDEQSFDNLSHELRKRVFTINGKIEDFSGKKYLIIYEINSIFEVVEVESEAIDGLRIIAFTYKKNLKVIYKDLKHMEYDTKYGLVNEKDELVSDYRYSSLVRMDNGNISALYPDPCNGYWKENRFTCILNTLGQPLFKYTINKQPMYFALRKSDAVSSCYYGIALIVKKNKIGIVDYKGKMMLEPIYDDIIIDKNNYWIKTVLMTGEHDKSSDTRHQDSLTSISYLFCKSREWPLKLYKLDDNYDVISFIEYRGRSLYIIRNKTNSMECICSYDGSNCIISLEYKTLNLLDSWYHIYETNDMNALFIASNSDGKYGIISIPTDLNEIDPNTGDTIMKEIQTVCPFIYDYIDHERFESISNVILIKDGKEGLFSCPQKKVLFDSVIPTIDKYDYSIIPSTFGEGLIGCKENIEKNNFSKIYRYFFSDIKGNRVLEVPKGWEIICGFKKGIAQIRTGDIFVKTAEIDKLGNITIVKKERIPVDYGSEDLDSMYRDAFEDDPNMEWNID